MTNGSRLSIHLLFIRFTGRAHCIFFFCTLTYFGLRAVFLLQIVSVSVHRVCYYMSLTQSIRDFVISRVQRRLVLVVSCFEFLKL